MSVSRPIRVRLAFALALAGLSACALFQREDENAPPNDRNIAAIFLAANNTDISYAQVAMSGRTKTPAITGYATRMLTDHGGLNKAALETFSAIGLNPADNLASLSFRDESAFKRDTLRAYTGAQFDSVYIANEVRYHTRLLAAIDSVLIPRARNEQLKSMLTSVRPAVAAHLEHAERIQSELKK